tara:strand:- start:1404 stop:1637 length:234 start_codon:yes stop_codon:yes gene_type:complete
MPINQPHINDIAHDAGSFSGTPAQQAALDKLVSTALMVDAVNQTRAANTEVTPAQDNVSNAALQAAKVATGAGVRVG